jgi:hypothetical protein
MNIRIKSTLEHYLTEEEIVHELNAIINALHLHTTQFRECILDLARYLDENKIYVLNQICRKIKEKLQDKITNTGTIPLTNSLTNTA